MKKIEVKQTAGRTAIGVAGKDTSNEWLEPVSDEEYKQLGDTDESVE